MWCGQLLINDVFTFTAATHDATGEQTDADSVPSYRVYEDETGTPILTGNMAKLDDAGTTGFYSEQITLSTGNGFEVGKFYTAKILGIVDGITGNTLRCWQVIDAIATADLPAIDGSGYVRLQATTHTGAVIPTVSTLTGHTAQTGDSFARIGAPVGASISADVAAVKAQTAAIEVDTTAIEVDTQDIQGRIPAALSSGRISAESTLTSGAQTTLVAAVAGELHLKKNTAGQRCTFFMRDATNAQAGVTGLTLTVQRSIDGAAFESATGSATQIGSGFYTFALSQADTNGDHVIYKATGAGAIMAWREAYTHA